MSAAIPDPVTEIRFAIGYVAAFHAAGVLDAQSMRDAVNCIEANLALIEITASAGSVRLPVMSLADVVTEARAEVRAVAPRPARPTLALVDGGRP